MEIFKPGTAARVWPYVNVFMIYGQFAQDVREDDNLRRIFSFLNQRHVALALETGMLTASDRCGKGVEGYGGNGAKPLASRIAQLGGRLAIISMDEPAWYGKYFNGLKSCQMDFDQLAGDVARNFAAVRTVFPDVRLGDTEPVGNRADEHVAEGYLRWLDALSEKTGESLVSFHIDAQWRSPLESLLRILVSGLRSRHVPVGMIYNGFDNDTSDAEWVAHAEDHYRMIEDTFAIKPDDAVFQSWVSHPSHLLPDNAPSAFTHLLSRYVADESTATNK